MRDYSKKKDVCPINFVWKCGCYSYECENDSMIADEAGGRVAQRVHVVNATCPFIKVHVHASVASQLYKQSIRILTTIVRIISYVMGKQEN